MVEKTTNPISKGQISPKESPPNIFRRTLAFNRDVMLCNFEMKQGAQIPLHNHLHTQIGYIISGKVRFFTEDGYFLAETGDSYVFNGYQKHGAEILEDTELIEVFAPCRDEYKM